MKFGPMACAIHGAFPSTGSREIFLSDVGEASWEEINFQLAANAGGDNYGWSVLEGMHCFNDTPPGSCDDFLNGGSRLPILEYSHSLGCSVTGGYRYRGKDHPELQGIYFYGDFCSGRIWGALAQSDGTWLSEELLVTGFNITKFGEDEAGELYVVDYNGDQSALYEIVSRAIMPRPRPPPVRVRRRSEDNLNLITEQVIAQTIRYTTRDAW
jgi:hypothetical protein